MAVEIEGTRLIEQVGGKDYWQGVRTLLTTEGAVRSDCLSLYEAAFPGFSGERAPVCKRTRAIYHPSGVPNVAMIQAYYETARKPGKARLVTQTQSRTEKIIYEPDHDNNNDSRIIEGPDAVYHWGYWTVTKGDPYTEQYDTILRLETAYYRNQFSLSDVLSLEGCVNEGGLTLVGFGDVAAETLKCLGVVTNQEYGAELVDITYLFQWSGPDVTWNQMVESELGAWVVQTVPVFNNAGVQTGSREAIVWLQGVKITKKADGTFLIEDGPAKLCITHRAKSFAQHLSGLTSW